MSLEPNKNRPMTRKLLAFAVMLSAVFTLTSCLGDDDSEIVYPGDAAITSFALGNLKCYVTTTSSKGADSTYTTTVTGTNYRFSIDQVNRQIYNVDSLPYGTDVAHVLCTIGSKNSSTVVIKNTTDDNLVRYVSSDSIDFSEPRQMSAYSLDGSTHVDYTVTVNVCQEKPDSFFWHVTSVEQDFAQAEHLKGFACGNQLFVITSDGKQGHIFKKTLGTDEGWQPVSWDLKQIVPADAYQNTVVRDSALFMLAGGQILRSQDGEHWTVTGRLGARQLIAASTEYLFALSGGGILRSSDNGATWSLDAIDANVDLLPTRDISYCCIPSRINPEVENVVIMGSRSAEDYFDDTRAQVWNKMIEIASDNNEPWMYVNNELNAYFLPRLNSLTAVSYHGGIVALGGSGIGACTDAAHTRLYYSNDGGIFWNKESSVTLPSALESNDVMSLIVDSESNLWLICGGSGQVWRGHLTGTSSKYQTAFTE